MTSVKKKAARTPKIKWSAVGAVRALYAELGNWRAVADAMGIMSAPYWKLVSQEKRDLTRDAENALRRYLRLPPRRCKYIDRMRTEDLRWYVVNRRELREEACL